MSDTKTCTHCSKDKPLSEYYSKGNRLDAKCKECVKELKKSKRTSAKKKKKATIKRRRSTNMIDLTNLQVNLSGSISKESLEDLVEELIKEIA